jgi:hypothetical protein
MTFRAGHDHPSRRNSLIQSTAQPLPEELASWGVLFRSRSYAEEVPRLFAWAIAHVHEETYEDAEYDQYEAECVRYDNAFTTRFLF